MRFFNKQKPAIGDNRWIRKFAWFPKQMGVAGGMVWLEHYISTQQYGMWRVPGPGHKGTRTVFGWREMDAWYCKDSIQRQWKK